MKPRLSPSPLRVVYLLHFEASLEVYRHYVGITTPLRVADRMREHCSGRAAARTAKAVSEGEPWRLANIWTTRMSELEGQMQALGNFDTYCPVCRGGPGLKRYNEKKKPPGQALGVSELLDLQSRLPGKAATRTIHEKGSDPKNAPLPFSFGQT